MSSLVTWKLSVSRYFSGLVCLRSNFFIGAALFVGTLANVMVGLRFVNFSVGLLGGPLFLIPGPFIFLLSSLIGFIFTYSLLLLV